MIVEEYDDEEYMAHVSFGGSEKVTLDMCVASENYDLEDEYITKWDEVKAHEGQMVKTENGIRLVSSSNPIQDKQVQVFYGGWTISGKWNKMEQISPLLFVYHCQNDLFLFDITFSRKRYPWDGNYESLLQE